MSLNPGTHLGPYEILSPLGAGGMGEVYRAKDTRLGRTVAIKVLPDELSRKAGLRQRFEREARAIASLNHPNICALHDVGQQDGIDFLVMEYLEGESLAERLTHGALKTELVVRYAIQIADGLDKAHRQGFVHRDLKPGNIMLTRSGVKLLDFGLAKIVAGGKTPGDGTVSDIAATATMQPVTAEGTIAGTLQYMAPEQLEGKEADARSDIFAFGTVLYEMATGKKAFEGKSQASLVAAIFSSEPKPILSLQPLAPPALEHLVQTCLAKDPEDRWHNAHDIMRELQWIAEGNAQPQEAIQQRRLGRERFWIAASAFLFLLALAVLAALYFRFQRAPAELPATYLSLLPPGKTTLSTSFGSALSPDGRHMAMVAFAGEKRRLWLHSFDSLGPRTLSGTEGALYPFWSPDSRFIGFFTEGKLKKIEVTGGQTTTLCGAPSGRGGTWNHDGVIVFAPDALGALLRVSAGGGTPTPVTTLDQSRQEYRHTFPSFLPDGRHFVYLGVSAQPELRGICVGSLDGGETKRLLRADSNAVYVPSQSANGQTGYLLFVRARKLLVQPFNVERLETTGDLFPLTDQVAYTPVIRYAEMSVSGNGVLAYRSGNNLNHEVVWCDRLGKALSRAGASDEYQHLELSPDGKQVALERNDPQTETPDIWLLDLSRDIPARLTTDPGIDSRPVWSPEGRQIAFAANPGAIGIYRKGVSGIDKEELLLKSTESVFPTFWSRDGRFIVYSKMGSKTQWDLWILPLAGDRQPREYLASEFSESQGRLSPDGRWMAYVSNESGSNEVYVQAFPAPSEKVRVSKGGGTHPRWRADGKELFYLATDFQLMSVAVKADNRFEVGGATGLFELRGFGANFVLSRYPYDVTADGQRFLILKPVEDASSQTITVVLNWMAGLKQ